MGVIRGIRVPRNASASKNKVRSITEEMRNKARGQSSKAGRGQAPVAHREALTRPCTATPCHK